MKPLLISIVGPTASGKSALAVALGRETGATILSADSVQVYRGLDIGSGKLTPEQMQGVFHRLIDILEPDQEYNAAEWGRQARVHISDLHAEGKTAIVAGGSGFYLQALWQGIDEIPEVDPGIRAALRQEFAEHGLAPLAIELAAADPITWQRIDQQNPARVLRALEVFRSSGRPVSAFRKGDFGPPPPYRELRIGLELPRETLYARIEARVDEMLAQGWLEETRSLIARYGAHCPALQSLGYRELLAHFQGRSSLAETIAAIKMNTRRYAKRQMTWFRRFPEIEWHPATETQALITRCLEALA